VAIEAEAAAIAGPIGADPDEIIRILYSRSDLNAFFVTVDAEATWERAVRAARVWRRIARILEAAGWPFDTLPPPGFPLGTPHPLSKAGAETLSARHDLSSAERKLREVQAQRRQLGINKGPQARSFQRTPVVRTIGRELWAYLARCMFARQTQNLQAFPSERIARLDFLALHGALKRTDVAAVTRQTVKLVNLAFPAVARLTPARLAGSIPAGQRRKARDAAS
jgi:hypothetical protein